MKQNNEWSPGLARVLSFLISGLGQIYRGKILYGLIWFVLVPIGYIFFIIPGLILHIMCIYSAGEKYI